MKPWRNLDEVTMPPRIAALPRDARGYPQPYGMVPGSFTTIDPARWAHAACFKVCGLCGVPLGGAMALVGGPLSIRNRLFTDLPMHRDCAEYALQVCPFLAAPSFAYSRANADNVTVYEDVSTKRPERFGLGITKKVDLFYTEQGTPVLRAAPFVEVTWWRFGVQLDEAHSI